MPETGLTLDFEELQKQTAFYLTGTRRIQRLGEDDLENVNAVVKNGLRRFYYPMQVDPSLHHDWSFLRSELTFKTEVGTDDYLMPYNFGGAEGPLYHDPSDGIKISIAKTTPDRVLYHRQLDTTVTNWPIMYAERPSQNGGRSGIRWQVMLWPSPSAEYLLRGVQRIHPLAPNGNQIYLYGGPEHSQTIIEACLAAAELQLEGQPGTHFLEFKNCLMTSIVMDQTLHQAETYGYNGNGTNLNSSLLRPDGRGFENFNSATYNNVAYTGS